MPPIENDDDMNKEWLQAIVKVGAPSALLIFVIVWLTGDFNVRLRAIETQHNSMLEHASRTEDLMGRSYMSNERVLFVLRAMCINDAKTAESRRLCLDDRVNP